MIYIKGKAKVKGKMYKIKETIIVEGIYDKIKLSGFIDSVILTTNGFTVFKNKKLMESIKTFAEKTGIVILTDSDSAGFKIRNYIKQSIEKGTVLHAYVPDIKGKEKRKRIPGKEGLLGVEGIDEKIILNALREADAILREEFDKCGLNTKVWQYFIAVPDLKSVGVKDSKRYEGWPAIIRAVNTTDAMSATIEEIPYDVLKRITARITAEVEGINRVLYDLTPKPVGTIEWE